MAATENITILFTDLVGSTELASGLAPEAADELRRAHFAVLRRVIASCSGTEVKNLGDGLMVVLPTASAGLSCSVQMQQHVDLANRNAEQHLGLRVGLSCGESTREGDDYFGDPVIEAARLCARAEGGQILASELVRAMAGRRAPYPFRALGPIELKGLSEPLETFVVEWTSLEELQESQPVVPLPARLCHKPGVGVIGRLTEAELLIDAFKRVLAGEGREVVLISGEAGEGKTTLAAHVARKVFDIGACVLLGRCDEDLGVSYGPFVEALTHYVTHAPEEALYSHVQSHGAELAKLVPALADRVGKLPAPQSSDPDTERYLLFGAVVRLLAHASALHPIVLVIDDMQWVDRPSLQLLRQLVTSSESMRLLVIGAYRVSELSASHPLTDTLAQLRRESGVSRIELNGLDDISVIDFMEAAAGQVLDEPGVRLAHVLRRETDGNPFFVAEVLRHLSETGAIYQGSDGRWSVGSSLVEKALPDSVREVISSRVSRLGDDARRVLSLAAVIGRDFDLELLSRVSERPELELLDVLEACAASALIREVADAAGHYSFSQALIQHTLYQEMGATRRAVIHRQVAQAIEAICGDDPGERVGELAHHWFNASQPVDAPKAISYARRAADAALLALAPDDAVRYYSQALTLCRHLKNADPVLVIDVLLGLGTAQRQAGIAEFRETLLDAARRARDLGATDQLVKAALANNRGLFGAIGIIDTDRIEVLEAALERSDDSDTSERALLLSTLCSESCFGPRERRLSLAQEAKSMARRIGDKATLVQVLNLVDPPQEVPDLHAERAHDSAEALELAYELGDPLRLHWAAHFRHMNVTQGADFEQADACLSTIRELSDRLGQPMITWATTYHEAGHALFAGDHQRAEDLATRALAIGTDSGQPDTFAFYGAQVMLTHAQQGRLGELRELIAEVAENHPGVPTYRAVLAHAHLQVEDVDEALRLLEAAATEDFASLPMDIAWFDGICNYADVAIELRAKGAAETLCRLLEPYSDQVPFEGLVPQPPVAYYLGALASVLGRYDESEAYFTKATELNTRGRMKFCEACTQLAWGRMMARRGGGEGTDRARELLAQARETGASLGYALVERRAAAELSKLS